jgi:hypothetical protein
MSTNNSDHDPTNSNSQPTTNEDLTGDDEIDFQLDIVDGEDPSRPVIDDRNEFNVYPPGAGPLPGTMRFVRLVDDTWAFIESGNFGGWINAEETISLDDVR